VRPFVRLDGGALAFELADLQAFAAERRVDASVGVLAVRLQPGRNGRAGAVAGGSSSGEGPAG
jgi:hypothetical protein